MRKTTRSKHTARAARDHVRDKSESKAEDILCNVCLLDMVI